MRTDRMTRQPRASRRGRVRGRRGSALFLALVMTVALGGLAISAIFLASNTSILNKNLGREQDYRYAAEAAIAIGKSKVNSDPKALPDTSYSQLLKDEKLTEADGAAKTGVTVNLWLGKSGATSGQFGSYASVVAEARDAHGSRFVRRLELAEENFAKYAYWSDDESNISGTTIYFNNKDVLWGPVWSNDTIHIGSLGATFNDDVGTARIVSGKQYGTFKRSLLEKQKPIKLPDNDNLAVLETQAASGNLLFQAPDSGGPSSVRMRIEFVAVNLNASEGDTDVMDDGEGFVRVYKAHSGTSAGYVRGDYEMSNCGDWHRLSSTDKWKFYPAHVHKLTNTWFVDFLKASGMSQTSAETHVKASFSSIMTPVSGRPAPRCFVGGDPHLVAVERDGVGFLPEQKHKGGEDTTFTANGVRGQWLAYPKTPDAKLTGRFDAAYLFPLYRGMNEGVRGVITVRGTVGVSGVLRERVTLYAKAGNVVLLDDMRYASDPKDGECLDMLGLIADKDIVVADNALNTPQLGGSSKRSYDDTKDFHLHAVMMGLGYSFRVEHHDIGDPHVNGCEGTKVERGCLYLAGGIIQAKRGAVGQTKSGGASGFSKRYSYDRCALRKAPPYYPTTGRYVDNRYYEVDPVGFDIAKLFQQLTSKK